MELIATKHSFSKSNNGAWSDQHSLTANNPYANIFNDYILNQYDYVIERIDAYGKILMADGTYRRLGPLDIDIYINGLNYGPTNPSGQVYCAPNQVIDLELGPQMGTASPDILFYYRAWFGYDSDSNDFFEHVGQTVTITYTTYFRRVKSSNFN